jgi:hypothetical protein
MKASITVDDTNAVLCSVPALDRSLPARMEEHRDVHIASIGGSLSNHSSPEGDGKSPTRTQLPLFDQLRIVLAQRSCLPPSEQSTACSDRFQVFTGTIVLLPAFLRHFADELGATVLRHRRLHRVATPLKC